MKKSIVFDCRDDFELLNKNFILSNHDTLRVNGTKFYTAITPFLKKMYTALGYSHKFAKDFFKASPKNARDFFQTYTSWSSILVNDQYDLIYVSTPAVYENYLKIFEIAQAGGKFLDANLYVSNKDTCVSDDQYLFLYDNYFLSFSISLVTEQVTFFYGKRLELDNMLFLLEECSISLADENFIDVVSYLLDGSWPFSFDVNDLDSLFRDVLDVELTFTEMVDVLKVLHVVKGYKNLQVLNDEFFLNEVGEDFLSTFSSLSKGERMICRSGFTVKTFLLFANRLLFEDKDVTVSELYKFYEKIIKRQLTLLKEG